MKLKILALSSFVVALMGCASTPEPTPITYMENENLVCRIPFDVPRIEPVQWGEFEWVVITQDVVMEKLQNDQEIYYIGLTYDGYTNLSQSMQEVVRYMRLQSQVIEEMETYYSK